MKKSIFKYLGKKIIENSTITEEDRDSLKIYKIKSLGFEEEVSLPIEFPSKQVATGLLVDRLVANTDYLKKLEQIENRKDNLKSLLD